MRAPAVWRHVRRALVVVALALLAAAVAAACGDDDAGANGGAALAVAGAWARETAGNPGENAVVYLTVVNEQDEPDRLVGAAVGPEVADLAHLHATEQQGELLRMAAVDGWAVEPGGTLTLVPGGNHVMLVGLAAPLRAGDRFPLRLMFEHAGEREVTVVVRSAAGE